MTSLALWLWHRATASPAVLRSFGTVAIAPLAVELWRGGSYVSCCAVVLLLLLLLCGGAVTPVPVDLYPILSNGTRGPVPQ